VRNLVRWLSALDPQIMQALPQRPTADQSIPQGDRAARDCCSNRRLRPRHAEPRRHKQIRAEHDSAITLLGSIVI